MRSISDVDQKDKLLFTHIGHFIGFRRQKWALRPSRASVGYQ